ncbi:MAG: BrnT family toxin [bacterium]|nr:BrnT family toxin [bacterium]
MEVLGAPWEFEWDAGNREKNSRKHKVSDAECEEIFFDSRKRILRDLLHSGKEERYILIGKTKRQRLLFVVFTLRRKKIRVISARALNKKERKLYEEKT